jgi:hypothetical protein
LKNCYDENARRQLNALEKGFASTLNKVREAVDSSLAEHHGKDIPGVMDHAVLADNSCMVLHLTPSKPQYQGPASFHRDGGTFESFYTADLSMVVPEIARSWDVGCLREWGEAVSSQFAEQWHQALLKFPSLSSREGAIDFYSEKLKDAVMAEMESQRELLIEPSKLLQECSIRQDLRGTVPPFAQVLSSCDCNHLEALKSFTGLEYESEFDSEYSRRINQAFADGRPYLGSEMIKSFRPGCLITIALVLGLIGLSSGVTVLAAIGGAGIGATIIGWLLSKRQARRRAIRFAEEVVGAFYQEVISDLETSIRDRFQPQTRAR